MKWIVSILILIIVLVFYFFAVQNLDSYNIKDFKGPTEAPSVDGPGTRLPAN